MASTMWRVGGVCAMSTTLGPIAVSFAAAWTVARTASARMVAVDVMKDGQGRFAEVDSVM